MRVHPITKVYKLHSGTDVAAPKGATFVAMAEGTVINASYNSAYGNMVMIEARLPSVAPRTRQTAWGGKGKAAEAVNRCLAEDRLGRRRISGGLSRKRGVLS